MTKTTIEVKGLEVIEAKDGKKGYTKFNTSEGNINVFDKFLIDPLTKNLGKCVEVELIERNGYKNITKFYAISTTIPKVVHENIKNPMKPFEQQKNEKNQSMYTSYAKDVFICLKEKSGSTANESIMQEAIRLVQLAKEAF